MNSQEILICLIFIIIGYFVAMIFTRMCSCNNGFSVGVTVACPLKCINNKNKHNCESCIEGEGDNFAQCKWDDEFEAVGCYKDSDELYKLIKELKLIEEII